ncbi:MAG: MFS transporter [Lachnospiraceae bacterium]|nr:MFS transporter [Lachnospiraceae bacterium]
MLDKKLPLKTKLALGFSGWANNLLILLNTYFLLYFYTDVVGISGGTAAAIMLIARVWDAVNDPMMGIIVDKTRLKEGKCRFWLCLVIHMTRPRGAA